MDVFRDLRSWAPLPTRENGIDLVQWILLEGNRTAVSGALLTVSFVSMLGVGSLWTFEMQLLLTETGAVETLLNTLLGGIILLVSIVVSINSIVLSHQITSLGLQQERIEDALDFRQELGTLSDARSSPTDPGSFLSAMATIIRQHAEHVSEGTGGIDDSITDEINEYIEEIVERTETLEQSIEQASNAQFGILWVGLGTDYSSAMDQSRMLTTAHGSDFSESAEEELEHLIRAFELFATGREYFKTLYYNQEVSSLSRRLLVISFPAILVTALTILAINAKLLPEMWFLGLPPLLTFVAATFTIALSPYVVLTAHMLRLTTVSVRTSAAGPFALES